MIATALPRLGASPRLASPRTASSVRSTGASTGSPEPPTARTRPTRASSTGWTRSWRDTRGVLRRAADDGLSSSRRRREPRAGRSRHAAVSERARHAASARTTPSSRAGSRRPAKRRPARQRTRPRGRRAAAVELGRRRPHRPVAPAGAVRRLGAAPQPAVPRRAHAARADARRLHRQLQRRRARCRCAGRRCSTRGAPSRGCASQGFERIGILGTSLGSCLSMLTAAHEPRIRAQALNHVSPWFADVVWRGLSTRHVRAGLERPHRSRAAAPPVAADQPVVVSRSRAQHADAAGLRAATT